MNKRLKQMARKEATVQDLQHRVMGHLYTALFNSHGATTSAAGQPTLTPSVRCK